VAASRASWLLGNGSQALGHGGRHAADHRAGGPVGTLTGEDYKQGGHIVGGTPKCSPLVTALAPHVTDA
jgi:hypothetical protein